MRAAKDDEVYFHKAGAPCCGRVLSSGKHGCVVEAEGQRHKLKWHQISGHKKRAPQHYKVIDQGEDGMIVENQHGQRRYMGVPWESRE